jgi:ABC-type uncharacterized transport system YnjBCD ATPase subunit
MKKEKITITVSGRSGVGKSTIMRMIEGCLCALFDVEVKYLDFGEADISPLTFTNRRNAIMERNPKIEVVEKNIR